VNTYNVYQTNNNFFNQEVDDNLKNEECKQLKSVAQSILASGDMTDIENLNKNKSAQKTSSFRPVNIHKPLA